MPNDMTPADPTPADPMLARDYDRIAAAIAYVVDHREEQPSLETLAAAADLSPHHFQRIFSRWAGVSPKRFLRYLTLEYAKRRLEDSASVLEASLDAGLSGPSRLHDLMVSVEAMTPGDYKVQGAGLTIRHGVAPTPYGDALFLVSDRGLCGLEFLADDADRLLADAHARWPLSTFKADHAVAQEVAQRVFTTGGGVTILLKGTPWQLQVWAALLRVPAGRIVSYGQIADAVCTRKASRAVGTAVAANTVGYVVPCHRVLRATGLFERYRWGAPRRWAMLAREGAESAAV